MFHNLNLHIIQFPSKRYGFVGTVPAALGDITVATVSDIMGGRAFDRNGETVTVKFPSFTTRDEAVAHAATRGFEVR